MANTIVQVSEFVDEQDGRKYPDHMGDLGVSVDYVWGEKDGGTRIVLNVKQNNESILIKEMYFLPCAASCGGKSENTDYEGSHRKLVFKVAAAITFFSGFLLIPGVLLYKGVKYVPKVFHVKTNDNDRVLSFTLIKNNGGAKELGVSKECKSILVYSYDKWYKSDDNIFKMYPYIESKNRKGLYGMYATTSTGWPCTEEQTITVLSKFNDLLVQCR